MGMNRLRTMAVLAAAFVAATLLPASPVQAVAERYKPFVLAWRGTADFEQKVSDVKGRLESAGFEVVTEFEPYGEGAHVDRAKIIVFTSDELKKIAAKSKMGGFAAPMRVGVTLVGDDLQVSYVNPIYMAHAYRLKSDLSEVADKLAEAVGRIETFGSRKGLTAKKLARYRYTFGMERFDKPYRLAQYGSHAEAVREVEERLNSNDVGISMVYRIDIPGSDEVVFGVRRKGQGEDGKYYDDQWIMSNVDFEDLKGTPYLPYEIMVKGNEAIALHMRFRMAVHYPDLKMMGANSFMNLMPSPKAIEKAFKAALGQ